MSNESEIEFVGGLFFKLPHENAPDFVKGGLSIKPKEMIAWLQSRVDEEWVNIALKVAKSGKGYAALDTWKPKEASGPRRDEFSDNGNGTPRNNAPRPARREPEPDFNGAEFKDDIPFITNRSTY